MNLRLRASEQGCNLSEHSGLIRTWMRLDWIKTRDLLYLFAVWGSVHNSYFCKKDPCLAK